MLLLLVMVIFMLIAKVHSSLLRWGKLPPRMTLTGRTEMSIGRLFEVYADEDHEDLCLFLR